MVVFDQLKLSNDGSKLYINAHVSNASYFKDVYIDSIFIISSDKVSNTHSTNPKDLSIYNYTFEGENKEISLSLSASNFMRAYEKDYDKIKFTGRDMKTTLFFVYIKCKGTVASDAPCGFDEMTTLGVTFYERPLFQQVLNYSKQVADSCCVPQEFVNFILLWNAYKASLQTGHYIAAIKYWKALFNETDVSTTVKGCNCHG